MKWLRQILLVSLVTAWQTNERFVDSHRYQEFTIFWSCFG